MASQPILWVLVGLPGAGKTTFAFQLWKENPTGVIRVCLDDLIWMASFYGYRRELEEYYRTVEEAAILRGLKDGRAVVVDRTNLTREIRARLIHLARTVPTPVRLRAVYFPITPEEALRRRKEDPFLPLRERFTGPVPWEEVIARMAEVLEPPSYEEGFHEVWVVRDGRVVSEEPSKEVLL